MTSREDPQRREAACRVGGAWTAPVLDTDPEARVPWVATVYAAGPSLTAAVTHGGLLPAHTVRASGAGLTEALTAVHALGLVHRDVKPSNVLRILGGPLLIDFGITRAMDGGIVALDVKTGKLRWTYSDSKAVGEPWQVTAFGNRLLVTHGPEVYALPAV
ncbi:hypothetical protein GCM10027162_68880 [Streptomyces incanus]